MKRFKFFRDVQNRFKFYSFEPKCLLNKFVAASYFTDPAARIAARSYLFNRYLAKKFSLSAVNNRCILTGRSKILSIKFRISRMEFRRLAKMGYIKGYKRASW